MISLRIEEKGKAVEVSLETPRLLACSSGRQSVVGAIQSTVEALMWELADQWDREAGGNQFISYPTDRATRNVS